MTSKRTDFSRCALRSPESLLGGLALLLALCACGGPRVDVQATFSVVHTAPHHGAIEVARDVVPYVAFSTAVGSTIEDEILLQQIDADGDSTIEVTRFVDDQGLSIRLVPRQRLEANREFRITVSPNLVAENGAILGAEWTSSFRTLRE